MYILGAEEFLLIPAIIGIVMALIVLVTFFAIINGLLDKKYGDLVCGDCGNSFPRANMRYPYVRCPYCNSRKIKRGRKEKLDSFSSKWKGEDKKE